MRKLLLVPAVLAAFTVAACAPQAQAPQIDEQAAANRAPSTVRSDDSLQNADDSRNGGTTVEDEGRTDGPGLDDNADDNLQPGRPLPAGFPLPVPEAYEVQAVGTAGDETSVVLAVPSGEDAYNYYRQALADEGFRVEDEGRNQDSFFEADLEFSDGVYKGGMEFDGDRVEIEVERDD